MNVRNGWCVVAAAGDDLFRVHVTTGGVKGDTADPMLHVCCTTAPPSGARPGRWRSWCQRVRSTTAGAACAELQPG